MLNQLPDREREVLVYLCDLARATHTVPGPLRLDRQEFVGATATLQMDEVSFRRSVGLLAHSGYLEYLAGSARGMNIDVQPQGYLAYAQRAFPTFAADREAIEAAIVARLTNSFQMAQDLGLPQFEVETVLLALREELLIRTKVFAEGRMVMHVAWVSPVLEQRYQQTP